MKTRLLHFLNHDALGWTVALIFLLLPTGTATPLLGVGLAGIIWLLSGRFNQISSIIKAPWFRPIFLFIALPWIGLMYSQGLDLGIDYAMKTKYWCLIFITASLPMDDRRTFILVKSLWIGLLAGALLALAQVMDLVPMIREGHAGFGIVHTLLCMYLLVGLLMAGFYFRRAEALKTKVFLIFLILMFLFHLTVLNGRGGYFIFVLISPLLANDLMHKFNWAVKLTLAVFLIISLLISPVVRDRINSTVNTFRAHKNEVFNGEYVSGASRIYILKTSFDVIKKHPFIGIGTGSLPKINTNNGHSVTHPHNSFLYMGVSFGVIGFISLAWVFWNLFRWGWRLRHTPLGYFVFSSAFILFLGGMFDSQILNTGTLIMTAMVYGFLNQLSKEEKERDL